MLEPEAKMRLHGAADHGLIKGNMKSDERRLAQEFQKGKQRLSWKHAQALRLAADAMNQDVVLFANPALLQDNIQAIGQNDIAIINYIILV